MKSLFEIYDVFLRRLSEIKEYIDQTMMQHELIDSIECKVENIEPSEKSYFGYLKALKSSTIQYNAIIISIYACYEHFVDSAASQYCGMVFQKSESFDDLPSRLKEKLRNKIGEYLSNPKRFPEDIDLVRTVENYSMMLSSDLSTPVDLRFVVNHSGNLRSSEVVKLFQDITGMDITPHILHSQWIKAFYIDNDLMDEEEFAQKNARAAQNLKNSEIMKPLEELVSQRNSVAHSWREDSRIGIDYISDTIIPFLRALSFTLLEICIISYLTLFNDAASTLQNGTPIATYNHNIVCFNNQATAFSVGDYIIYGTEQQSKCAKILSLQHNSVAIDSVDSSQNIDVGIKIDGKIAACDTIKYIINL